MLQKFNPKNASIKVYVNGTLFPRDEAKVSVFDSSVQGGDAVWEGLRVYKEGILQQKKFKLYLMCIIYCLFKITALLKP